MSSSTSPTGLWKKSHIASKVDFIRYCVLIRYNFGIWKKYIKRKSKYVYKYFVRTNSITDSLVFRRSNIFTQSDTVYLTSSDFNVRNGQESHWRASCLARTGDSHTTQGYTDDILNTYDTNCEFSIYFFHTKPYNSGKSKIYIFSYKLF
jgi:hypothetical protein